MVGNDGTNRQQRQISDISHMSHPIRMGLYLTKSFCGLHCNNNVFERVTVTFINDAIVVVIDTFKDYILIVMDILILIVMDINNLMGIHIQVVHIQVMLGIINLPINISLVHIMVIHILVDLTLVVHIQVEHNLVDHMLALVDHILDVLVEVEHMVIPCRVIVEALLIIRIDLV